MCTSWKDWTRERKNNEILLILSYEYNNNGFLLWWDNTFKMYAEIGIWNLCCEYMKCEIDKMFVRLDVMGISDFMLCYVWTSSCLLQNRSGSLCNVCFPIRILSCDRAISSQSIDSVTSPYRHSCVGLYCMEFWCA